MLIPLFYAILTIGSLTVSTHGDPRYVPISKSEFLSQVHTIPLDSPEQQILLLRARHSHLADIAYDAYSHICSQRPSNAQANFLAGLSLEYLQFDRMMPERPYGLEPSRGTDYFGIAADYLHKAHKLDAHSARACAEYGYVLWQYKGKMDEGLQLIRHAKQLDGHDPTVHVLCGLVYTNPTGNAYAPMDAFNEFKIAVREDPNYAFPHQMLANMYLWCKPNKALKDKEEKEYKRLIGLARSTSKS